MNELICAIFRSHHDAFDAWRTLREHEDLPGLGSLFLFPLAPSASSARAAWEPHEVDYAEYAGHGEQMTVMSTNRFVEPRSEGRASDLSDDKRAGRTLLCLRCPPQGSAAQFCAVLKNCGAFAIQCAGSRWRLCNTRQAGQAD
jgi:hypothetical protein